MKKVLKVVLISLALLTCLLLGIGLRHLFSASNQPAAETPAPTETEYDTKKPGSAVERNQASLYYRNGQKLLNSGDFASANAMFTQVIRARPAYQNAYTSRALARLGLHDNAGAAADFSMVIKMDPGNSRAYADRGLCRFLGGDGNNALLDYNSAIELDPTSDDSFCGRADVLFSLGDKTEAAADYSQALRLNPRNAKAYAGLSRCNGAAR